MQIPTYRYNRNSAGDSIPIFLGKHKYNNGTVRIMERRSFGVHIIAAITRYGKTTLVKNTYTQIAQYRPLIILDYLGEHTLSKYPNFLSRDNNTACVPELIEIKDFKFKISQFTNASDWLALGFSDKGSLLMRDLALRVDIHRDDPQRFMEILEDVPSQGQFGAPLRFENTWGFSLPMINSSTLDSCKTQFTYLLHDEFFGGSEDPVYDFGELALQNHYININFNLDKSVPHKARAIAGKALEQVKRVLDRFDIPPLIVVEEADVIAPKMSEGDTYLPTSTIMLIEFVLKLQKKRLEILFIVQDLSRLHPALVGNRHTLIIGQLPTGNEFAEVSKQLAWDIDKNYREFILMVTGTPGYEVFVPFDSMTLY